MDAPVSVALFSLSVDKQIRTCHSGPDQPTATPAEPALLFWNCPVQSSSLPMASQSGGGAMPDQEAPRRD